MFLCGINLLCSLLINPNILMLLVLLIVACMCGAVYSCSTNLGKDSSVSLKNDINCSLECEIDDADLSIYSLNLRHQYINWGEFFWEFVFKHNLNPNLWASYKSDALYFWKLWAKSLPENKQKHKFSEAFLWSLSRMFDYGEVKDSINSKGFLDGCVALLLFLLTWLIGGGGLIGSVITIMKHYFDGGWRRWWFLLWGHTVILGWNDNGVTLIREHIESRRVSIFGSKRKHAMPERIVILTSNNVDDVKRKIKAYLRPYVWSHLAIRFDVYRCEYDDLNELKRLNLVFANAIYVLGEDRDFSHDARALMIPQILSSDSIRNFLYNKFLIFLNKRNHLRCCFVNESPIKVDLHLFSFGLYSQLMRMQKSFEVESKPLANSFQSFYVMYRNCYDSWAKRLFANYYTYIHKDRNASSVKLRCGTSNSVHLVIIGFSEMGQALAVQAARVAHYGENIKTYITIFDDEIESQETEFRSLFPRIDEIPDVHWTFMHGEKVGSDAFLDRIMSFLPESQLTIAIACDNSAYGMKIAIPIYNLIQKSNNAYINILLRQDIVGKLTPKKEEAPLLNMSKPSIRIFGMKDGGGYNAWYRDIDAFELYKSINEGKNENDWCKLSSYEKGKYQLALDIIEETYNENDDEKVKEEKIQNLIIANHILDYSEIDRDIIENAYNKFGKKA